MVAVPTKTAAAGGIWWLWPCMEPRPYGETLEQLAWGDGQSQPHTVRVLVFASDNHSQPQLRIRPSCDTSAKALLEARPPNPSSWPTKQCQA